MQILLIFTLRFCSEGTRNMADVLTSLKDGLLTKEGDPPFEMLVIMVDNGHGPHEAAMQMAAKVLRYVWTCV